MIENWLLQFLPRFVARVPANIHAKLLAAFLAIVILLIAVGAVGLQVLSESHHRAEELVKLQRKIAVYRQLQHDTTAQLYSVARALLVPDEGTLDATLRQLNQFGYDVDRLHFVAKDEVKLLAQVRKDYDQFIQVVNQAVELIHDGKIAEGNQLQLSQANPLAERLERLLNQLVNRAEADMVASVEASDASYTYSRWIVIGFALGSIALALVLGYAISWSVIGPVRDFDSRLKQIAAGDFSRHVEVLNRDELGTLAANLNRTNDALGQLYQQLETANRHKSEFLANVNHELRTPVSAIIGYARLVLRMTKDAIDPLQRENLLDLLHNAERLLNMIDSLLEFARIEAGKIDMRVEPVNVAEIVRSTTSAIEPMLQATVRLAAVISPELPELNTDREKLREIILNLLSNAVKFTERGEIRITAARQDGGLKLVVADSGIGIEPEDLHRIFEEFHRGNSSRSRKYQGTGLGLAIVKKFVNLLGGEVAVESEVGKGSVFTVTLPLDWSAERRHGPVGTG